MFEVPQIFDSERHVSDRGFNAYYSVDYESYWSFHLLHLITDMSFIRTKLSVSFRKGAALIKICRSLIDECLWLLSKA